MSVSLEEVNYASRYAGYPKDWLSPDDLENEYGISKSTQGKYRMEKSGSKMPFSKVGKYIRYNRNAINRWLEVHQVR